MGEFDSNPVAKSLEAYHRALATGASDGTMAGELGASDRRREQAKSRSSSSTSWSWDDNKDSNDTDKKVLCTELVRQGLFDRADYLMGARYVEAHLTARHMRGYHAWALPVVRRMRRSRRATAFWRALAQARADHIAYLCGDLSRRNRFGALLCAIGHPVCYVIGGLVGEQDWRSLYTGDGRSTAR